MEDPILKLGNVFDWFANQFFLEARADFVAQMGTHLASLFNPGDRVLDLCCGAGPVSLFLGKQGAEVTGIDFAPILIALAKDETQRRGSKEFYRGRRA